MLENITGLCTGHSRETNTHHQRLLRNLDAQTEVLNLLKMPCSAQHEAMVEVHKGAHKFLQYFCSHNGENQTVLSKHVPFLIEQVRRSGHGDGDVCLWLRDKAKACKPGERK